MATVLKTEAAVLEALRNRYDRPAWALFAGVANGTGHRARRWADAVAMSLWPSRGLAIFGFEIKTDRRDLLRELKNPKKADAVGQYCDQWWVAAGSKDVCTDLSELPPAWGLMVPHGKTMKVVREAQRLEPKEVDRGFVAAVLRRADEQYDLQAIRRQLHGELYAEIKDMVSEDYRDKVERAEQRENAATDELQKIRGQLRAVVGHGYTPDIVGQAIDFLYRLDGWAGGTNKLKRAISDLQRLPQDLETPLEALQLASKLCKTLLAGDEESPKGPR